MIVMEKSGKVKRNSDCNSLEKLDFEIPSWEQIHSLVLAISDDIEKSNFKPDIIVGISRGGWIPARIVSDFLGNSKLGSVSVEFYEQPRKTKSKPTLTQPISVSVKDKKILLVDDVADTGQSLKLVETHLKSNGASMIKIASIYYKPWSIVIPDYYRKETSLWIIFPWEIKESLIKLIEKFRRQNISVNDIKRRLVQLGINSELIEKIN
jgi:hypoxanthine phosphoribosyltransferase